MNPFRDRIALVTGGASGIGRAVGHELGRRGAVVVLADVRAEPAEAAAQAIREAGGRAEAHVLDVTDSDAVRFLVDGVVERLGRLDFLFNNAGIGITGEVSDMSLEAWNRIIDVNLKGVIHGVRAAYPHMIRQGSGHIANTACVAGLVPFPMTSAYCATKHAVIGLSTSLRAEAAAHGVEVSVVCPGVVATEMFERIEYIRVDPQAVMKPVARAMVSPERCARLLLRGVAQNRSIITISSHAGMVWWLYRFAPRIFIGLVGRVFRLVRSRFLSPRTERSLSPDSDP